MDYRSILSFPFGWLVGGRSDAAVGKPVVPPPQQQPQQPKPKVMLILRGISGHFDGRDWERGALYEQPALEYAQRRGYVGRVLDVSGETGADSDQVKAALAAIRADPNIHALYGFSGGGYNVRHILNALGKNDNRMDLVVVLGAPKNPKESYIGTYELVYRLDPPAGHMAGPAALLAELSQPDAATFADRVYRAMKKGGFAVADGNDVFNIIYVEGMDPDGTPNKNRYNAFDDLRMLLQVVDGKPRIVFKQDATTEPGKFWSDNPMNSRGAFHIALGQQTCWVMGEYHDNPALVQEGPIKGYRAGEGHYRREGPLLTEGDIGVHHHGGYNYPHDDLGRSSAGCQVGRLVAQHAEFMRLLKTDRRYRENRNFKFTSTVLTADEVVKA